MSTDFCDTTSFNSWQELLNTPPQDENWHSCDFFSLSLDNLLPRDLDDENLSDSIAPTEMPTWTEIQYPGELEDRRLIISNLHCQTTIEEITEAAGHFGDIANVERDWHNGIGFVKFYDLRNAWECRTTGMIIHGHTARIQFAPPEVIKNRRKPPNNGTIVLFHLLPNTSDDALHQELSKYGKIRQIRSPPDRDTQRFVEFWDTRHAESAIKGIKGHMLLNARVSIEYSLPGGYRKNPARFSEFREPTVGRRNVTPLTMSF